MSDVGEWGTLVPELDRWATVRAIGPGRLEVTGPDPHFGRFTRELRITPDQWGDIEGVIHAGDAPAAAALIRDAWDRAEHEHRFLVYDGQYDVQPSETAELPDPTEEMLAEFIRIRAENPEGSFGWFAYPPGDPRNDV